MNTRRNIAVVILVALFLGGTAIAFWRFSQGLGATTALSDDVPWGLWIAVKLCFIALAAGAFCLATGVYILHLERYRPLVRPTVLTGLLFYTMFLLALLLDLGRPLRIWHPVVMWQHHSVLFEVSWCMMLYSATLAAEFSPALWERLGLERFRRWVHAGMVPLVIVGVVLSLLHQSSLGSLFLIVPEKLHPLWYTPLLQVFFLLSAIGSGLAVVIVVTFVSSKMRGLPVPRTLLAGLARATVWIIALYALLRLGDLLARGGTAWSSAGTLGWLFLAEIILGVAVPLVLLASPRRRARNGIVLIASGSLIAGTCLNRFNVSLLGLLLPSGATYLPTWMETGIVIGLVAFGLLVFTAAAAYLPLFDEKSAVS